jgi:hypothetical protein
MFKEKYSHLNLVSILIFQYFSVEAALLDGCLTDFYAFHPLFRRHSPGELGAGNNLFYRQTPAFLNIYFPVHLLAPLRSGGGRAPGT